MDLNPQLDLRCPKCETRVSQKVQRRMNSFWGGLSVAVCEGCKANIQWHHSLHRRFRVGGFLFRCGLFLALASLANFITQNKGLASLLLIAGVFLTFSGILWAYTKHESIKVERHNNALSCQ